MLEEPTHKARQSDGAPRHAPRPGRAANLLRAIVIGGHMSREALAAGLSMDPEDLERYAASQEPMPLNHQARLALFVIATLPALVREGNRLRAQVAAAISYNNRAREIDSPFVPRSGFVR